jgi:amino acid transporter
METSTSTVAPSAAPSVPEDRLARNALGLTGVLFLIVTGTAPLGGILFNDPVMVRGVGIGAPAALWIGTIVLTVFSVGYVVMARRVTNAGGFYSFTSHGFGRVVGLGVATLVTFSYFMFAIGTVGLTAYFANTTASTLLHVTIDWRIWAYFLIVLMFLLSYFRVAVVARILGVFLIGEIICLVVFAFAVLFQAHLSFTPLSPAQVSGSSAKTVFASLGGAAIGIGFFAVMFSWTGFEMAPNYGEEAREPRKTMGRATYTAVIGLGVLFTFLAWMLVNAYGGTRVVPAVAASLYAINPAKNAQLAGLSPNADLSNVFYPMGRSFVGLGFVDAMKVLVVTSSFAGTAAFWTTSGRYLVAMGREGVIPRWFGRTHGSYKSPYTAAIFLAGFAVVIVTIFATGVTGTFKASDPLTALTNLATWLTFQGVLGLVVVEVIVSLAIVAFFQRHPPEQNDSFQWWKTGVAPVLAAAALAFVAYEMVKNRSQIAGTVGYVTGIPYYVLAAFAVGVVLALVYRYRAKGRYQAVGRFVHQDVDSVAEGRGVADVT